MDHHVVVVGADKNTVMEFNVRAKGLAGSINKVNNILFTLKRDKKVDYQWYTIYHDSSNPDVEFVTYSSENGVRKQK